MPQGHIKKGFFFYFGLLVLVLFAVFMVCVVIMIFNPGKSVLWLQYFSSNTTYSITGEDSNGTDIDWSSLTEIEIRCSYADVTVEKDDNKDYSSDGIYIKNNAKGFAVSSSAVDFSYTATLYNSGKLIVEVTESTGFLYFSKNVDIVLHAREDEDGLNFDNIKITIVTTEGDVNLGGSYNARTGTPLTAIGEVDVTTDSGDIYITNRLDTDALSKISFKTTSGDISSRKSVEVTNAISATSLTGTGLDVSCPVYFETESGTINLGILKVDDNSVEITCKKGNFVVDYLEASEITLSQCEQGNYILTDIYGDFYFESYDTILSPNVTIKGVLDGDFLYGTAIDNDGSPNINIAEITGALTVYVDDGSLTVGKTSGAVEIQSNGNLTVNLTIADGNNNAIGIENGSGNIVLNFGGSVSTGSSGVVVRSSSGSVTINITNQAKFVATMYNASGTQLAGNSSQIRVNIGSLGEGNNPLEVNKSLNGDSGIITIYTNGTISFNLV